MLSGILSGQAPLPYPWMDRSEVQSTLEKRIHPPHGVQRDPAPPGSFQDWLRHLPLKPGNPPVHLYNGSLKRNQQAQAAVVDIDVGSRNLQQCADAVLRLRAEYLWAVNHKDKICFHFTSGDRSCLLSWEEGWRPEVRGRWVRWVKSASPSDSYRSFRAYLDVLFTYAGSYSLSWELNPVLSVNEIRAGDVFIQGGFPGHAVLVVDTATGSRNGERFFLLAQSYMPAQEIHLLKNLEEPEISPWFRLQDRKPLVTPEWTFPPGSLMRW